MGKILMIDVNIKQLTPSSIIPTYATGGAACFDIYADGEALLHQNCPTAVVSTGLAFEIPEGYVMNVYSRSGHGFKNDVRLGNCVGKIDSDYRGALFIKLTLDTAGYDDVFVINYGDRIAQAEIVPVERVSFNIVETLNKTERGENGLGSTGW